MPKKRFPWPIDQMRQWYEKEGMSLEEVAERLSSDLLQSYWRLHLGREYRPGQKIVNKVCKRAGFAMRSRGAPAERNGNWAGGRNVDKAGYILVRSPDHPHANHQGYVREHRLVAEKSLGRYLLPTEVVHHIDDDPGNNDPSNLMVYDTNAQHISETMKGKVDSSRMDAAIQAAAEAKRRRRAGLPPLPKTRSKRKRDGRKRQQTVARLQAESQSTAEGP